MQSQIELRNLSKLNSLVILNLSNMKIVNLSQELKGMKLQSLQFLNISNNQLAEI